jgi:predicted ATPase
MKEAVSLMLDDVEENGPVEFVLTYKLETFSQPHELRLRFDFGSIFPTRTTVLIGKNGTGKSQAIRHLSEYLIGEGVGTPEAREGYLFQPLRPFPHFSEVIVVSFSPFEKYFNRDIVNNEDEFAPSVVMSDKPHRHPYTYCGLRNQDGDIDLTHAERRAMRLFIDMLAEDEQKFRLDESWLGKYKKLLETLDKIVVFDCIVVHFRGRETIPTDLQRFVNMSSQTSGRLDIPRDIDHLQRDLVHFLRTLGDNCELALRRGQHQLKLSAGQHMMLLLAVHVISRIKRRSLLLLDEPELYLHPSAEVEYIRIVTDLVDYFGSFCVIATHSALVVREVPTECVRVMGVADGCIPLSVEPSIQTFGADVSRVMNYVFENLLKEKPHEKWLDEIVESGQTFEQVLERYGGELNTESIIYLRNKMSTREKNGPLP